MSRNKFSAGLLLAAARSAILCCGIFLISLRNGSTGNVFPLSLIPYTVAAYLYNRLILRKDRAMTTLIWANLILLAAYFTAVCLLQPWKTFKGALAALVLTGALTAAEAKDNVDPIGLHNVIIAVDISFLNLAVSMAVLFSVEYSAQWSLCAIAGAISAFAALLSYRLDGLSRAGRIGVLSVGAAAGLVITFAASQRFASSVGKAIVAAWNAVLSALGFAAEYIERFFLWLASFAPEIEGDIEFDPFEGIKLPAEEEMPSAPDLTWLFYVLLVCAAVAVLIYVIKKKPRASVRGRASAVKISSESLGLRYALRRLFEKLRRSFALAGALRKKRRTAAGVYLRISKCAVRPQIHETAREYLTRLSAHECVGETEKAALLMLADAVNRQLYSRSVDEDFSRFGELRFFKARLRLRLFGKRLRDAFSRDAAAAVR